MTAVVRPYRGVSAQERRAERRARLIEACLEVVGSEGVLGTTVDRVCAAAGLTKRYFYESFSDLDELLRACADSMFAAIRLRMSDDVARQGFRRERTRAVLGTLIETLESDPRLARLYLESPGHPVLRQRRDEAIESFTEFVASDVLVDDVSPGQAPKGVDRLLATRVLVAGTTDLVTAWLSGHVDADPDSIIDAVEHLAAAL